MTEFHAYFPGGTRWRVTPEGVELEGSGVLLPRPIEQQQTHAFVSQHVAELATASRETGVAVELIAACALTQSQGDPERRFVWRDPGYFIDSSTPTKVSAGACRLLVSMAQSCMNNKAIDRRWLFELPNSLLAAATIMARNGETDPVLAACAFNAGGLFEDSAPGNVWRLRQYAMLLGFHDNPDLRNPDPNYATDFCRYYAAALALKLTV